MSRAIYLWTKLRTLNFLTSRQSSSKPFRKFTRTLGPSLAPFKGGKAQFLWEMAVERAERLNKPILECRPHCVVESGLHYSERFPNAVCSLIGPNHYAIACFSSL